MKIPEFMLCEDPADPELHPFIYHEPTRTLLRAVHKEEQDELGEDLYEIAEQPNYQLRYKMETIYIIAVHIDMMNVDFIEITKKAAYWYADYLDWEDEQNDKYE